MCNSISDPSTCIKGVNSQTLSRLISYDLFKSSTQSQLFNLIFFLSNPELQWLGFKLVSSALAVWYVDKPTHATFQSQGLQDFQGKRHVHTLLYRVPHVEVAAVCSSELHEVEWAKASEEYREFGITVYDNYDKMLSHTGLQAVWVATSTDVHASQSLAAIEKGLHVLCEKPLSTDLAEVGSGNV